VILDYGRNPLYLRYQRTIPQKELNKIDHKAKYNKMMLQEYEKGRRAGEKEANHYKID